MPTVSVIIPAYNRPDMLKDAVESALAQTFTDIEVIIVLNGATPETSEMAHRIGHIPKVRVVEMARSNLPAARNFGLRFAQSEWVGFLDDDDVWLPEKLEVQLAAARATGADVITCNFSVFNDRGDLPHPGLNPRPRGLRFAEALMLENCVSGGSAVMVKTAAIRSLDGFDVELHGSEDWDMWRRLSWDHEIAYVNRVLVKYRRHVENLTDDYSVMPRGVLAHFTKLRLDTPPKLKHMLPAAKRRHFFNRVRYGLLTKGGRPDASASRSDWIVHGIVVLLRGANKLGFGLLGKAWHELRRWQRARNAVRWRA